MKSPSLQFLLTMLLVVAALACAESTVVRAAAPQPAPHLERTVQDGGVANLPFARGAVFSCLDDYLAHLRQQGAIDLPWWREIRPGVYERVVRMPGAQREVATRAELMQRFGFNC